MRHLFAGYLFCIMVMEGCRASHETTKHVLLTDSQNSMSKELIILATPPNQDSYYADMVDDIFAFHIGYVEQARQHDDIIILAGSDHYDKYVKALGTQHVVRAEMQDIWMRDFSTSNVMAPIMFRYTSEGQGGGHNGQKESDFVQENFTAFTKRAGVKFDTSHWRNDGGNFVDDYSGNVVLSRKFLRDNGLTEQQGRRVIQRETGIINVAFIDADEQGGLEHADGVVAFITKNTLVINSYPADPEYAAKLKSDLKRGLPGVMIHEIVTPYDSSVIYDARYGSACGLYTNMLVTPERIYFPQFGIAEDIEALTQVQRWTDREVIPVQSSQVCYMGGGVRCMSWQLRGEPAKALLRYIGQEG